MRTASMVVICSFLCTSVAHAQGNVRDFGRPGPAQEREVYYVKVRKEVNDLLLHWQQGWNRDNASELAAFYTPDATFFPVAAPAVSTRSEIRIYFAALLPDVGDVDLRMLDFGISGDLAYATTRTSYWVATPPGASRQRTCTDMFVLRRRSDGSWLIQMQLTREEPPDTAAP